MACGSATRKNQSENSTSQRQKASSRMGTVITYDPDPVVGDVASPTGGLVFEC